MSTPIASDVECPLAASKDKVEPDEETTVTSMEGSAGTNDHVDAEHESGQICSERQDLPTDIECPLVAGAQKQKMDPDGEMSVSGEASFCTNVVEDTDESSELCAAKPDSLCVEPDFSRFKLYLAIAVGCIVMLGVDVAVALAIIKQG